MDKLNDLFGPSKDELIANYLFQLDRWLKADPRAQEKSDALKAKDEAVMALAAVGLAPGQVDQKIVFTLKGLEHEIDSGSNGISGGVTSAGAGV